MTHEFEGPVSAGEVRQVIEQLRDMSGRAQQNGQQTFFFVLTVGAESLSDNLAMACDEVDADA